MSEQWSAPAHRRVTPPSEAPANLKALGLTVEIIHRAIEKGDIARRRVDRPVYPVSYPGVTMWATTLAALRQELLKIRQGWKIGKTGNYETVYSEERKIAFAVVAGDSLTGVDGKRDPKLKRKKGPKTRDRIERNAKYIQTALSLPELEEEEGVTDDEACETWFIMVRASKDKIYIEVSRPIEAGDGNVDDWSPRHLVEPLQISGAIAPIDPYGDDDDDDGEELVGRQP
ncbi:hypothetical protein [Actinomadura alba]|uniref:Uncharacterized protein n=1 Tax=Actinomadura alba TaxID=406431 RepID=A0ABR7LW93_9ACTN|nr:hypothetical protein [Actinomadura alba]MBC6469097.1 hypothetical protein [Actinomadura alba]